MTPTQLSRTIPGQVLTGPNLRRIETLIRTEHLPEGGTREIWETMEFWQGEHTGAKISRDWRDWR